MEITSAYLNNERLITSKEKALCSVKNYVAKALTVISKHCSPARKDITSRPVILKFISERLQIDFKDHIPCKGPFEHKTSQINSDTEEIQKLLQKKVITKCIFHERDFSIPFCPSKEGWLIWNNFLFEVFK